MNILKRIWKVWRAFGQFMADAVGRVVMLAFYFTLAAPFGLGVRLFSDPLKLKPAAPRWEVRETEMPTLDNAKRAF